MASERITKVPDTFAFNHKTFDWELYLSARPKYPQQVFDIVFDHHARHGNGWEKAYDMGTGMGIVASKLSPRFKHVVASDPSDTHIATAHDFLKQHAPAQNVSIQQCKAEDSAAAVTTGPFDLVTMAEAIHYTDIAKTVDVAAQLVVPGGTFAVWAYDIIPRITGTMTPAQQKIQKCLYDMFDQYGIFFSKGVGVRPMQALWSDLACVKFPREQWKDVKRMHWNRVRDWGEWTAKLLQENPLENHVMTWEEVEIHPKDLLTVDDAGFKWLNSFLDSMYPGVHAAQLCPPEYAALLESAKDAEPMQFGFSASIVLATRR